MAISSITDVILQDITEQFRLGMDLKDSLESKATALLGFLSVFLSVLVSVATLTSADRQTGLLVAAMPVLLQIAAVFLLFRALTAASLTGPLPVDTFELRGRSASAAKLSVAISYGWSVIANRRAHSGNLLPFQTAVLMTATSLLQLFVSVVAAVLLPRESLGLWPTPVIFWLPSSILVAFGSGLLVREHRELRDNQDEELSRWRDAVQGRRPRASR